jgi:hypothetical protein
MRTNVCLRACIRLQTLAVMEFGLQHTPVHAIDEFLNGSVK